MLARNLKDQDVKRRLSANLYKINSLFDMQESVPPGWSPGCNVVPFHGRVDGCGVLLKKLDKPQDQTSQYQSNEVRKWFRIYVLRTGCDIDDL